MIPISISGTLIVGSVEGQRLWGKEISAKVYLVQWSTDGKMLFLATKSGEVQIYDSYGNFMVRHQQCLLSNHQNRMSPTQVPPGSSIIAMDWYNGLYGYVEPSTPTFAIAFDTGKVKILRDERDNGR
jgi:WD repeat-containing protein 35